MEFSKPPSNVPPNLPPQHQQTRLNLRVNAPQAKTGPRVSKMAVISCVLGWGGFILTVFSSLLGIIFGHVSYYRVRKSNGELTGKGWAIAALIGGYLNLAFTILFIIFIVNAYKEHKAEEAAPFGYVSNPPPFGHIMTNAERLNLDGVTALQGETKGFEPAQKMQLRVYLPAGYEAAAPGSLPCVLVAPAGTDLLSGAALDDLDEDAYHDESLPYAQAGFVTVLYSIDGYEDWDAYLEDDAMLDMTGAQYKAFKDAQAGILNGRHALEFVLTELPKVDPTKVYTAGHSSAGTLSLLFAMHEPRIAGCVAYAPGVDLESFHKELIETPFTGLIFPGVDSFLKKSSPLNNVEKMHCPTFLFQSKEDDIVTYAEFLNFERKLKASPNAPEVTMRVVNEGDHYYSMIEEGMPLGIEWLKEQAAK